MSQSETTPPPPSTPPPHFPVVQNDVDQKKKQHLKYLDFLQLAAVKLLLFYSTIYQYAKNNSGPLRPGVQTVEGAVRTAIGPLYRKFHNFPLHLLLLVDRKLDEWIIQADRHAPGTVKEISRQALAAVREVRRIGLAETGARVLANYEPVAKQYAVAGWRGVKRVPLLSQVVEIVVPTAAYWAEKYNKVVGDGAERGYRVWSYLPLVPVGGIAKIFQGGSETEANGGTQSQ